MGETAFTPIFENLGRSYTNLAQWYSSVQSFQEQWFKVTIDQNKPFFSSQFYRPDIMSRMIDDARTAIAQSRAIAELVVAQGTPVEKFASTVPGWPWPGNADEVSGEFSEPRPPDVLTWAEVPASDRRLWTIGTQNPATGKWEYEPPSEELYERVLAQTKARESRRQEQAAWEKRKREWVSDVDPGKTPEEAFLMMDNMAVALEQAIQLMHQRATQRQAAVAERNAQATGVTAR